jgi:hypothetical protein
MRSTLATVALVGTALLAAAAPAHADSWPVVFNNYCTVGSIRVCASSNVGLSADGKTLTIDFWNNERLNDPNDVNGQRSTITAIGLYHNPSINLVLTAAPTFMAQYFPGSGGPVDVTSHWKTGDSSVGTLAGIKLDTYQYGTTTGKKVKVTTDDLSDGTRGNAYGIVGCNDPTPGVNNHLSTCLDAPGNPFVRFTFSFVDDIRTQFTAADLNLRFHAQQLSPDGSIKCDTGVATGPGACASTTTVTPEPMSMALLGTGLFGVGVAAKRRRRKHSLVGLDL